MDTTTNPAEALFHKKLLNFGIFNLANQKVNQFLRRCKFFQLKMFFVVIDFIISTAVEYTKTLVREIFLLYFQFLSYLAMFVLHFFYRPGHFSQTSSYESKMSLGKKQKK